MVQGSGFGACRVYGSGRLGFGGLGVYGFRASDVVVVSRGRGSDKRSIGFYTGLQRERSYRVLFLYGFQGFEELWTFGWVWGSRDFRVYGSFVPIKNFKKNQKVEQRLVGL